VSFQGGHSQQVAAVERALAQPTRYVSPFEIIVDGWSCLESSNTVFLSVVPTQEPKRGHQLVNDLLKQQCRDLFDRYLPSQWQPHITVAMQDLSDEGLQRAKGDLRAYHPCYRQILSNLHLVHLHQAAHRIEIVHSVHSYVLRR
jgi:2'-5' RNA ligase